MTETSNKNRIYKTDYTQYGGEINVEDFNTSMPNKERITNMIAANTMNLNLQEQIKKKQELEKYKKMTLEELKKSRIISNTNGRPPLNLTDEKWQKEFDIRKLFITPYKDGHIKKLIGSYYSEKGSWNKETSNTYYGCTNWQSYCSYINDILKNIRSGQVDYCYFIYQIVDLLKFHYEDLRTRFCDGYWEVWLEKN